MDNILLKQVAAVAEVQKAAAYHKQKQACILTGLSQSSKPVFFAAVSELLEENGSIAIITSSREEIRAYRRELNYLYPDLPMQELYPVNLPRIQADTQSLDLQAGRAAAFYKGRNVVLSLLLRNHYSRSNYVLHKMAVSS